MIGPWGHHASGNRCRECLGKKSKIKGRVEGCPDVKGPTGARQGPQYAPTKGWAEKCSPPGEGESCEARFHKGSNQHGQVPRAGKKGETGNESILRFRGNDFQRIGRLQRLN